MKSFSNYIFSVIDFNSRWVTATDYTHSCCYHAECVLNRNVFISVILLLFFYFLLYYYYIDKVRKNKSKAKNHFLKKKKKESRINQRFKILFRIKIYVLWNTTTVNFYQQGRQIIFIINKIL